MAGAVFEGLIDDLLTLSERDREPKVKIFCTYCDCIMADWMYKEKVRVLLTLSAFGEPLKIVRHVFGLFLRKRLTNSQSLANFIRITPSMQLISNDSNFRAFLSREKWKPEAYRRNPQELFLALKQERTPGLVKLAKEVVAKDARFAKFFRVVEDDEMATYPNYVYLVKMNEWEKVMRARVTLFLSLRGIANAIRNGKKGAYLGVKHFDYQGNEELNCNSYVRLIGEYAVGVAAFKHQDLASLRPPELPIPRWSLDTSYYPKDPLDLRKKKTKRKTKEQKKDNNPKAKKARVSNE